MLATSQPIEPNSGGLICLETLQQEKNTLAQCIGQNSRLWNDACRNSGPGAYAPGASIRTRATILVTAHQREQRMSPEPNER